MKIYDKEKEGGVWVMRCPLCESVQASADEHDNLPEFTSCDCDETPTFTGVDDKI